MHPGERFTLNLRDPGDGGYSFLTPSYDGAVLKMVGEHRTAPSEPRRMGDFGRMVYEFEAVQAGQTTLIRPHQAPLGEKLRDLPQDNYPGASVSKFRGGGG